MRRRAVGRAVEGVRRMLAKARQSLPHRDRALVPYGLAVTLSLTATLVVAQLGVPTFAFEKLVVLLVVVLALAGGRGPAVLAAIVASVGGNILLREPIGRPTIDGFRDVADFALFLSVAAVSGWLVNKLRAAKEQALVAAERERLGREQRDQLVATVTHDLTTPLTAIQGTIQFARKNDSLSVLDLPRLLLRIETAATRAISLVTTLQDVRSLEDDALSLNLRRTDLRSVVEPAVRMLDRVSDRHSLALALPATPLVLECDTERIGRVVENLVVNAIKYSPAGGVVNVSAVEQDGVAVVRVEDTGIGLPAQHRERLFELGYRADTAVAVAPGLGLGLYIASAIVRKHGGGLEASDRPAGGTVFTVRLPLARALPLWRLQSGQSFKTQSAQCVSR